nr:MAG TPA: restriction alleviation protein [Caudoviricetes sp.]
MGEKCICCGRPISAYPCKFCGQSPAIEDECPHKQGAICLDTRKVCPHRGNQYFNCEVLRHA